MSDKGKEQWAKVPFNVSHNILGCDVVFGDGTTARLGRQDVNKKIFQQIRTGQKADMGQMLTFLLQKTNTRKQSSDHPHGSCRSVREGCFCRKATAEAVLPAGGVRSPVQRRTKRCPTHCLRRRVHPSAQGKKLAQTP